MGLPKKKKSKKLKENRPKGKRKKKEVCGGPAGVGPAGGWVRAPRGSWLLCLGLRRKISAARGYPKSQVQVRDTKSGPYRTLQVR